MKLKNILNYILPEKRTLTALNADVIIPQSHNDKFTVHGGNAMRIATVFTCVSIRRDTVGMLPVNLYREDRAGNKEIAKDHPAYNLIHKRPNAWQTPSQFWGMVSQNIDLHGECFAIIQRKAGKPVELNIVNGADVEIKTNKFGQPVYYHQKTLVDYVNILHFKEYSLDGKRGISKISEHRETIGAAKLQREYSDRSMNVVPPIYVSTPNQVKVKDEGLKSIREKIKGQAREYFADGTVPLLDNGLEIKTIGLKPVDAAYLEQINATKEDIFGIFRIPPAIGGSYRTGVTYNNLEQQNLQFLIYTLSPLLKNFEEEINEKLFSDDENCFVKFNVNALLRTDLKSRAEWYSQMFKIGVYTQNEIRKLEDLNPFEGGDKRYVEGNNMVPIDQVGQPAEILWK